MAVVCGMSKSLAVTALTGIQVIDVARVGEGWVVSADGPRQGACLSCGEASTARHGSYRRSLHDLPAQGASVIIELVITRLKRANKRCDRWTPGGQILHHVRRPQPACPRNLALNRRR